MREKARVGWFERIALKPYAKLDDQCKFDPWSRALKAGALGQPRGVGRGGRREGVQDGGTHVHPWLVHVDVWQKPPQHCKVISLQLK